VTNLLVYSSWNLSMLRHTFISIPAGKGLLSPLNKLIRKRPAFIYLHRNKRLRKALAGIRGLLRESTAAPTMCKELVSAWPDYIGVKDASKLGVGGIIIGENKACVPTVFCFEWPQDIKDDMWTAENPEGHITNSDLEMAGLLMLWLCMEEVCSLSSADHVGLFSDNSPTVHLVQRMASKSSEVAGDLLYALAMRMKLKGTSSLTPLHIAGTENAMTDIPSRSFGSEPEWHCETDEQYLDLFNSKCPLPNQASWSVFCPSFNISMNVISVLRMKDTGVDGWRQLRRTGRYIGEIGSPMSNLWE